ncbi:MAG: ribonuclease D [Vicinamibacteria bacterium]
MSRRPLPADAAGSQTPRVIERQEELTVLCEKLAARKAFSLDTEFVRERTFFIQLGIIQVAAEDLEAVVDPRALSSLEPLFALVSDPGVEKIVHAGEQDFAVLYEAGSVVPQNVFDTQIAAALVGYGDQISYARLVAKVTGVQLEKLETLTDWTARPLTEAQIDYSLEDVRYLPELRRHLGSRLRDLGRAGWEVEECRRLSEVDTYRSPDPRDYYKRLKASGLSPASLGVLREVAAFREQLARSRNLPRGWVLRDQSLIEIARRRPQSVNSLRQIRSLKPQQISKDGEAIVAAARKGEKEPVRDQGPEGPRFKMPEEIESSARLLEAWLYARASDAEIAPSMLATRGDLKTLAAAHYHSQVPELALLEGWRRELVGQDLLDLLDGKKALKLDGRKGKLEAVEVTED